MKWLFVVPVPGRSLPILSFPHRTIGKGEWGAGWFFLFLFIPHFSTCLVCMGARQGRLGGVGGLVFEQRSISGLVMILLLRLPHTSKRPRRSSASSLLKHTETLLLSYVLGPTRRPLTLNASSFVPCRCYRRVMPRAPDRSSRPRPIHGFDLSLRWFFFWFPCPACSSGDQAFTHFW